MVDAAKYADLVLLLVDASFGFEMETFEFLNILQVRRLQAHHVFALFQGFTRSGPARLHACSAHLTAILLAGFTCSRCSVQYFHYFYIKSPEFYPK